jgi:hypothetical protein
MILVSTVHSTYSQSYAWSRWWMVLARRVLRLRNRGLPPMQPRAISVEGDDEATDRHSRWRLSGADHGRGSRTPADVVACS